MYVCVYLSEKSRNIGNLTGKFWEIDQKLKKYLGKSCRGKFIIADFVFEQSWKIGFKLGVV